MIHENNSHSLVEKFGPILNNFFFRNKPYDSKKSVWMTDGEGGFIEGLLQSDDGKKAVVMVGHEVNFHSLYK